MEDSIKDLAGMTVRSIKREGVKATARKVYSYLRYGTSRKEQRAGLKWLYADVL